MIPFIANSVGKMLKKAVNPNSPKKIKNPSIFSPSSSQVSEMIIKDFCENQNELISYMEAVKDQDTSKLKVPTPISRAVNIKLSDAFEVLVMHERRHFNQAKYVMDQVEFPK